MNTPGSEIAGSLGLGPSAAPAAPCAHALKKRGPGRKPPGFAACQVCEVGAGVGRPAFRLLAGQGRPPQLIGSGHRQRQRPCASFEKPTMRFLCLLQVPGCEADLMDSGGKKFFQRWGQRQGQGRRLGAF